MKKRKAVKQLKKMRKAGVRAWKKKKKKGEKRGKEREKKAEKGAFCSRWDDENDAVGMGTKQSEIIQSLILL